MAGTGHTAIRSMERYFQVTSPLCPLIPQYRNTGASRRRMQRLPARLVPVQDTVPDFLGRLGKPEQIPIFRIDDTFVYEEICVECTTPIGLTHQHDGDWLDLTGLYQSQNLEQFVERAITTRKRHEC